MQNDNILYVPIQINGGESVDGITLKDRELFIDKNGVVYVGTESDGSRVIVGKVIPGAEIDSPKIINKLFVDDSLVVEDINSVKGAEPGQVVFVREKQETQENQ